jgi:hypothetical protein
MSYSPTSGHAVIAMLEVGSQYTLLFRMFGLCLIFKGCGVIFILLFIGTSIGINVWVS